jgi:MFS transporter, MHS family, citrate/tricarballylate:H+ symporter
MDVGAALESPGQTVHRAIPLRQIAAVAAGNALEFYSFLTYTFFSVQIGRAFVPSGSEDTRVLFALIIFGIGFITRPLGAFFIGRWGDRVGRKPAMFLSFSLMGIAILGLALTPSFSVIGWAAPALFVSFRLLQGFALGGEVGPTTAYLLEVAPPLKRGFYSSLQFATQDFAVLMAGVVGLALSETLDVSTYDVWGWRIAFLLGGTVIPFALIVRSQLPESLAQAAKEALPAGGSKILRLTILGLVMLASVTVTNYVLDYVTTFAENTLHLAAKVALTATVMTGLCGTLLDVASGTLSDRIGRRPVMLASGVIYLIAAFPMFYAIVHLRSVAALMICTGVLAGLQGLYSTPIIIGVTEGLPARIRSGGLGLIYAFAISTFGGVTQPITKALIDWTGSPLAPAGFMSAALFCAVIAMLFVRETAPGKTGISA